MDLKSLFAHPISSVRQWAMEHERLIAVNLSWTLAVVFIIVSIVKLLQVFGVL